MRDYEIVELAIRRVSNSLYCGGVQMELAEALEAVAKEIMKIAKEWEMD